MTDAVVERSGHRFRTFRALRARNYRLYMTGQLVSLAGTAMQVVAQALLVLEITGSGTALGVTMMFQFLPIFVFGLIGGAAADRFDRRRFFMTIQALGCVQAVALGLLVTTDSITLPMINAFAFALGLITAAEGPTKQALVYDIVGPDDLTNAVSLNIALQHLARVIGPAIAAVIIARFGVAPCFYVNSVSYVAVLIALALIRMPRADPVSSDATGSKRAPITEAIRFVWQQRRLRILLISCGVMFALAWEYEITLPLLATYTFHGGASTIGLLLAATGVGAVVGALTTATLPETSRRGLIVTALLFGLSLAGLALAPNVALAVVATATFGATGISLAAQTTASFQRLVPDRMRGRVMSLWIVATVGTRPFGAPIIGYTSETLGPRYGPAVGAVVVLFVIVPVWIGLARRGASPRPSTRSARSSMA